MGGFLSGRTSLTTVQTADIANDAITLAKMAAGTDGNVITYDTSGDPAVVATGTSGHFLKSAGAGAVPTFAAAGGGLQSVQVFTSNGTWTKPAGITKARVQLVSGGGGGAGTNGSTNGGHGGGAGGYSEEFLDVSGTDSETVTVGAGGAAGGSGADGSVGGATSFGSLLSATGGTLGETTGAMGTAGVGSGGDINLAGSVAGRGVYGSTGTGGSGGNSYFGGGGDGGNYGNAGTAGQANTGGGGGGGGTYGNAGAAGGSGIVIVWEYA